MIAGRLAPALEVAGGYTIPFKNWQTMPFLKTFLKLLRPLRPELEIQLEQFKEASSKPAQLKAFNG
jgi:hypothetical protein